LKNVNDEVNIESRGRSMTPRKEAKRVDTRKTPKAVRHAEDAEVYLKYVKIQSEFSEW
jgi:hypothetical protein